MMLRWIAIIVVALLAAVAGLIVSVGISGLGPLAGTPVGRWLGERMGQPHTTLGVVPASEGQTIGTLDLTGPDGHQPQSLPSPPGRRVLVNVWASWCVPCRDEMPMLADFAKSQGAGGVVVVGVAEDQPVAVRTYLRQTPVNYPILLDDPQWRSGTRLGNKAGVLPFTALIDPDGRLLRRQYGPFADARALQQWATAP